MTDASLVNRLQTSGLQRSAAEAIAEAIQARTPRSEVALIKWGTGFAVALAAIVVFLFSWHLESVRDDLRVEIGAVKTDVDNLKEDVRALRTNVETLSASVATLSASVATLDDRSRTQGEDIAAIKALLEAMHAEGAN